MVNLQELKGKFSRDERQHCRVRMKRTSVPHVGFAEPEVVTSRASDNWNALDVVVQSGHQRLFHHRKPIDQ